MTLRAIVLTVAVALAAPASASAGIFGTNPINIAHGANGDSGSPTISGDNRKTRYVAFYSDATNLVRGDSNGKRDIFLWSRPRGRKGLTLPPGSGSLKRVSVSSSGKQANGDSFNPSLDGSVRTTPHCVAFQSAATNLAAGDRDTTTDIYVRDLRTRKTYLVSRGIAGAASDPSIDGKCQKVAFVASNTILVAPAHGGRAKKFGIGRTPNFSRDGSALTWAQGSNVMVRRNGRKSVVGTGTNPTVTDNESGKWAVSYDAGGKVLIRVLKATGGPKRTIHVAGGGSHNGGITLYGANRGIVTWFNGGDYFYFNEHSGNSDDIAHVDDEILEAVTSARANFVAFSSGGNVYFKHLVDGERL